MKCLSSIVAVAGIVVAWGGRAESLSPDAMRALYDAVKTPFKFGVVLAPEKGHMVDNPCVFRQNGKWFMIYIDFDGKGYETRLAESDDLLRWRPRGCVFHRGKPGDWDSAQADGWPLLLDPEWNGSNALRPFDGRYWMMYVGGAHEGYEADPLSTGVAWTDDPSAAKEWTRHPHPVLGPDDADARWFEKKTVYKHFVVEDPNRRLGARFVSYYNAKQNEPMTERIGVAVSDDLLHWRRVGKDPVIDDIGTARGISGDPMIRRIGSTWVMFYFGFMWKPGVKGAFDTFAASKDLVSWTKWNGEPLVRTSESWDRQHAHKPWVLCVDGIVYHFYCAVGDGGRAIALATSKPMKGR